MIPKTIARALRSSKFWHKSTRINGSQLILFSGRRRFIDTWTCRPLLFERSSRDRWTFRFVILSTSELSRIEIKFFDCNNPAGILRACSWLFEVISGFLKICCTDFARIYSFHFVLHRSLSPIECVYPMNETPQLTGSVEQASEVVAVSLHHTITCVRESTSVWAARSQ